MRGIFLLASVVSLASGAFSQETAPEEVKPGLVAEFFNIGKPVQEFPTIAADRKPDLRRIDRKINFEQTKDTFPGTQMSDHFYVRWTGRVKIARDAKYTFFTESDDG